MLFCESFPVSVPNQEGFALSLLTSPESIPWASEGMRETLQKSLAEFYTGIKSQMPL